MRTFFAEIKGLVNSAFHALYDEVQRVDDKDAVWKQSAMTRGLAFMNDRRNENAIIDSVVESEDACRSLTRLYFAAMHDFVRETLPKKRDLLHVNFVPFGTFIAHLYRKLSGVPEMKDKYFTTLTYTEKDTLLRDVLRQVMQASVVNPTAVPLSFSTPIRPSDSVSNITPNLHQSTMGTVVGCSVANVIMSALKEENAGLSPQKLSAHNQATQMNGESNARNGSRFSRFTTASVVGTEEKQNKVITLNENNAQAMPRTADSQECTSTTSSE